MNEALRIVVVSLDLAIDDANDVYAVNQVERSRSLRIGLLESGFNLVASLPADVFLTERLAVQSRGRQVCSCFNVTDVAIGEHLARCDGSPEDRLASLQKTLQCGTNCGSCGPELQRMIRSVAPVGTVQAA